MVAQDRRSGSGSWIPGLLATFWLILAGIAGAYLFLVFTNPNAARVDRALASAAATPGSGEGQAPAAGLSAEEAEALTDAIEAKDKEIAKLKHEVKDLSSQVAEFDNRLKPIEKVLGPVAALPRSTAVTTSPPAGTPPTEAAPEPVEAAPQPAPPPPAAAAAPEPPAAPEPAASAPEEAAPQAAEPTPQPEVEERTIADVEDAQPPVPAPNPMGRSAPAAPEAETAPAAAPEESELAAVPEAATGQPASPDAAAAEPPAAGAQEPSEIAALVAPDIPPGTTRFGIELGAVEKQDGVRPMWRNLLTNHAALVAGLQARRIIAPDKKWRLIAGPFSSAAEAMQACTLFKKVNMPCEATVFAGDAL